MSYKICCNQLTFSLDTSFQVCSGIPPENSVGILQGIFGKFLQKLGRESIQEYLQDSKNYLQDSKNFPVQCTLLIKNAESWSSGQLNVFMRSQLVNAENEYNVVPEENQSRTWFLEEPRKESVMASFYVFLLSFPGGIAERIPTEI